RSADDPQGGARRAAESPAEAQPGASCSPRTLSGCGCGGSGRRRLRRRRDLLLLVLAPIRPVDMFIARLLLAMSANLLISSLLLMGTLGVGVGSGAPIVFYPL